MKYTRINGIDKDWSRITLGCWQLAPSEGWGDACSFKDSEKVVKNALACGITAFDTAEGYGEGESERRLGKALGNQKDDVVIVSKIWPDVDLAEQAFKARLDGTLKALGRDYVDLYLIHWPADHFNSADKSSRLADIMESLKASGKAYTIGLSNFHYQDLKLIGDKLSRFAINQVPYSLLRREYEGETLELCEKYKISYMAYAPTCKGLLARALTAEDLQCPARKRPLFESPLYDYALKVFQVVVKIAAEVQVEPIDVALAWVLAQKNILTAIVGSRKPEQVKAFAKGSDLELTQYQLAQLNNASDVFEQMRHSANIEWK